MHGLRYGDITASAGSIGGGAWIHRVGRRGGVILRLEVVGRLDVGLLLHVVHCAAHRRRDLGAVHFRRETATIEEKKDTFSIDTHVVVCFICFIITIVFF